MTAFFKLVLLDLALSSHFSPYNRPAAAAADSDVDAGSGAGEGQSSS